LKGLKDKDFKLLQSAILCTSISHGYAQPIRYEEYQLHSTIDDEPVESITPIETTEPKKSKGAIGYHRLSASDVCPAILVPRFQCAINLKLHSFFANIKLPTTMSSNKQLTSASLNVQ